MSLYSGLRVSWRHLSLVNYIRLQNWPIWQEELTVIVICAFLELTGCRVGRGNVTLASWPRLAAQHWRPFIALLVCSPLSLRQRRERSVSCSCLCVNVTRRALTLRWREPKYLGGQLRVRVCRTGQSLRWKALYSPPGCDGAAGTLAQTLLYTGRLEGQEGSERPKPSRTFLLVI